MLRRKEPKAPPLPEVDFSAWGDVRYMHVGARREEGSMLIDKGYEIQLEYVLRRVLKVSLRLPHPALPREGRE